MVRSKEELRRSIRRSRREKSESIRNREAANFIKAMHAQPLPVPSDPLHFGAYIPMKDEPDIMPLLAELALRPHDFSLPASPTLWFPQTAPDNELTWFDGTSAIVLGPKGLAAGKGAKSAVTPRRYADLQRQGIEFSWLFLPALAVGADGTRLGQGGGYYDRFLPCLTKKTIKVACLYDNELYGELPFPERHDQRADYALTPKRLKRLWRGEEVAY